MWDGIPVSPAYKEMLNITMIEYMPAMPRLFLQLLCQQFALLTSHSIFVIQSTVQDYISKQDVPVVLGNKHARGTGVPCPTVHLAHQWRTLLQNKQTTMFHTLLASGRSMLPCTQSYLIEMLPKTCYNFVVLCKTCLEWITYVVYWK